jgi:Cu+-exporting ATPase
MRTFKLALVACLLGLAGCSPNLKPEGSQAADAAIALPTNLAPGQVVLRFAVAGMTCQGCAGGLRSELRAAPGVAAAEVSLNASQALVIADTNRISAAQLTKVIKEAGFEARVVTP